MLERIKVEDYYKSLSNQEYTLVEWRKGSKGWLTALIHTRKVWVWDSKSEKPRERTLIIRRDQNRVKYSLSNFTIEERKIEEFAYMQGQRYWVERAIQENIGELGMTDYQVRTYNAWYHHMALVMMAQHCILKKKLEHLQNIPLLSTRDVRLQTTTLLMLNGVRFEKEIEQMVYRHLQRQNDIDRYYKNKEEPIDELGDLIL